MSDDPVFDEVADRWELTAEDRADPEMRKMVTESLAYAQADLNRQFKALADVIADSPYAEQVKAAAQRMNDAINNGRDRVLRRWWNDPC